MSISGFVQAGGRSRRMGENKALLNFEGRTLIEYSVAALAPIVSQLGIITNNPELYLHLTEPHLTEPHLTEVEFYADIWPGEGPLAGIGAALAHAVNLFSIVLACDMPLVGAPLLSLLVDQVEQAMAAGQAYQVCVPTDAEGQLQPLCALYHQSCLPVIEQMISERALSPRALFQRVRTHIVPFEQFAELPGAQSFFENINTPAEFEKLRDKIATKDTKER